MLYLIILAISAFAIGTASGVLTYRLAYRSIRNLAHNEEQSEEPCPTSHVSHYRLPISAAIGGIAFACLAVAYGPTLESLELAAFSCILLFVSLTDVETMTIPNTCIVSAFIVRVIYLLLSALSGAPALDRFAFSLEGGIVIGAGMLVFTLLGNRIFRRTSMGGGDIKLFAVSGFYFGWQQGLLCVFIACILGIASSLVGNRDLSHHFPFGPSIACACLLVMLIGKPLSV